MANEQPSQEGDGSATRSAIERLRDRCSALFAVRRTRLLLIAVVALIAAAGAALALLPGGEDVQVKVKLETALAQLDAKEFDAALLTADKLRRSAQLEYEDLAGLMFVYGVVLCDDAARRNEADRVHSYLVASRYLQEAQERGFPPGREAQGVYLLGKSLYHSHRYAQALPALRAALERAPEAAHQELHQLLASAYLLDSTPDLARALEFNGHYLDSQGLPAGQRLDGLLERSDILYRLRRLDEARQVLDQIPADSQQHTDSLVMRGRLLIAEGERLLEPAGDASIQPNVTQAHEKFREAITLFRTAENQDRLSSQTTRSAQYLIGVALRKLGDLRDAESQFAKMRRLNFSTPEGLVAGIEEADLQRLRGKDDLSITTYRRILHEAGDPETYANRWLSLEQLQIRVIEAYKDYIARARFRQAIDLTKILPPIIDLDRSAQLRAEAYVSWAQHLLQQATQSNRAQAEVERAEARAHYRAAGGTYEQLAKLRTITRHYPDDLWHSAESYLLGRDYQRAITLLNSYLNHETRRRRPRALIALGEAYLALNELDKALAALNECIQFHPRDPDSYRARLIAAQAYLEKGSLEEAQKLLADNLHHESLTPDSIEWRDSQFLLGNMHYRQGMELETKSRRQGVDSADAEVRKLGLVELRNAHLAFQQAIRVLSEAVLRYPAAPQAIEARYLIAEAYRHSAKYPIKRLPLVTIETTRNTLVRQLQQELTAALEGYQLLQELLNHQQQQRAGLPNATQSILRNCYFAQADVLFDLGRYEDAIDAYTNATNRYQDEPECMEAYVQIATCLRRLDRPLEARGTLEQAKVVLGNIRQDANFTKTTRFNRTQWQDYLNWLTTIYDSPEATPL